MLHLRPTGPTRGFREGRRRRAPSCAGRVRGPGPHAPRRLPRVGADAALVAVTAGKSARGCGRPPDPCHCSPCPGRLPGRAGGCPKPGTGGGCPASGQDSGQPSTAGHPRQMPGPPAPTPPEPRATLAAQSVRPRGLEPQRSRARHVEPKFPAGGVCENEDQEGLRQVDPGEGGRAGGDVRATGASESIQRSYK